MPTITLKSLNNKVFDARPDRIDLRDREYQPNLVSLNERCPDPAFIKKYLPDYVKQGLVLDQGTEGSCTGFGLAAVVNFLLWRRGICDGKPPAKVSPVSPRMLYQMARIYDEWPGEDYEGSSCRGGMKGWHKHGVCGRPLWEYVLKTHNGETKVVWVDPDPAYLADAATRPIGAYYRINKDSIADLQSAVNEVGAVYVSANVHGGWSRLHSDKIAVIGDRRPTEPLGGHAFALVGFTPDGFIVQNSWGPNWGTMGFAILPYDQWANYGMDAWVAVMGAPMRTAAPKGEAKGAKKPARTDAALTLREDDLIASWRTRSTMNLDDRAGWIGDWSWSRHTATDVTPYKNPKVAPYTENVAYQRTAVLSNNGRPINQFLDRPSARAAVAEVVHHLPLAWLRQQPAKARRLVIYAHGGLNNEPASIKRVRILAPYFIENGIYPLFVTWKTGVWESISGALCDAALDLFGVPRAEGLGDALAEAKDYTVEKACEHLGVKGIWSEMKQNADAAADPDGGLAMITEDLTTLLAEFAAEPPGLSIHCIGHSAGAILLGRLLGMWNSAQPAPGLQAATCSLWAPACTVGFAAGTYVPAMKSGTLQALSVEAMDDERERADSVGAYGKSLLYLVSRALEQYHKTPLLGMERAWTARSAEGQWNPALAADASGSTAQLRKLGAELILHDKSREFVSDGRKQIRLAHGSFDNDVEVVERAIGRILGRKTLPTPIENLGGF